MNSAARALMDYAASGSASAARTKLEIRNICTLVSNEGTTSTTLHCGGEEFPVFAEPIADGSGEATSVALRLVHSAGSDEVYRRAFHASPNPIIVSRLSDGCVVAANVAVERVSGYAPGEMIGRRTGDVNLWVDNADRDRLIAALRARGRVEEFDAAMRHRCGEQRVFAISAEVVEVGGEPCMITVAHDVTERKQVEQQERESRQRYQALMDNSPSVIFLKSVEGKYLVVNKTFERVLGVKLEDIIGRGDDEIAPPDVAAAYRRDDARLIAADGPITCDDLLVLPSGVRHFFTVKFPLRDESGRIYAIGGIATDFTDRYRAEQELERKNELLSIIRQSQSAYISGVESESIFGDLLGAFLRLTTSRAGMVRDCRRKDDRTVLEVMARQGVQACPDGSFAADESAPLLLPGMPAAVPGVVGGGQGVTQWVSLPLFRRGNLIGVVDLLVGGSVVPEELARSVDPLLQTCAMLIEARHAEEERAQAVAGERTLESQLREAAKLQAIGTLAGGIAHDFNNILTGIFNGVDLARTELGPTHAVEPHLERVMQSARRARNLVQQILTFSRRTEHQRIPVSLATAVREAAQFLRATMPATVRLDWRSDEALTVHCDPTQLHQVLINLGTNAAYAMRDAGGTLMIEAARVTLTGEGVPLPSGDYARLTVSDTGEGMDETTLHRIFEPFYTTKPAGEGTGLGLAVVHGIVKSHGGAITVESAPQRGTQFHVFLPAFGSTAEKQLPQPVRLPAGRGEKVYWIDDEPMVTDTGALLLERLGYRVVVFNDPELAWKAIAASPEGFDLVITDLSMPVMTGLELGRRLRELRPAARVMLMTGFSGSLEDSAARQMGFSRLLMKPFAFEQLANDVRDVIDGLNVV
jgi:PAS domain S-box-containing protein